MSGIWEMMLNGAGVGAWVVGAALVLTVALPMFVMLLTVMARVLRIGKGEDEL